MRSLPGSITIGSKLLASLTKREIAEGRVRQGTDMSRRRTAIFGLMAREAGGVAGVVRGVMNHIDVRKADAPNQESAEESGKDRRDEGVRSGREM